MANTHEAKQEVKQHAGQLSDVRTAAHTELQEQVQGHGEGEGAQHESTLFAEPITVVKSFVVSNSYLTSLMTVIVLVVLFVAAGRKIKSVPRGVQNLFEIILEGAMNFSDSITGDREKTERFLPLVLSLFLFILVSNWMGILPGISTIGFVQEGTGHEVFVPFFRGATADLNTTLALALVAIVATHVFGVMTVGGWNYLNRFINIKAIAEIPRKFPKDRSVIYINPIKAFVSLIEIIGEFAKIASLSFRLFGNIFAGEVLLISITILFAFLLPIPFMFLEILVGVIQAMVFSVLILVFLTMSTSKAH